MRRWDEMEPLLCVRVLAMGTSGLGAHGASASAFVVGDQGARLGWAGCACCLGVGGAPGAWGAAARVRACVRGCVRECLLVRAQRLCAGACGAAQGRAHVRGYRAWVGCTASGQAVAGRTPFDRMWPPAAPRWQVLWLVSKSIG